jgi:hypothetical protein
MSQINWLYKIVGSAGENSKGSAVPAFFLREWFSHEAGPEGQGEPL